VALVADMTAVAAVVLEDFDAQSVQLAAVVL
jgi:hypothetical protein